MLWPLDRGVNDGFKANTQSHLLPVLATSVKVILKLKLSYALSLVVNYLWAVALLHFFPSIVVVYGNNFDGKCLGLNASSLRQNVCFILSLFSFKITLPVTSY